MEINIVVIPVTLIGLAYFTVIEERGLSKMCLEGLQEKQIQCIMNAFVEVIIISFLALQNVIKIP